MGTRSKGNRRTMVEGTLAGFGLAALSLGVMAAVRTVLSLVSWGGLLAYIAAFASSSVPFAVPAAAAVLSALACLRGFWVNSRPVMEEGRKAWATSSFAATVMAAAAWASFSHILGLNMETNGIVVAVVLMASIFMILSVGLGRICCGVLLDNLRVATPTTAGDDGLAGVS